MDGPEIEPMWKRIAVYSALAACAGVVAWLEFRAAARIAETDARAAATPAVAIADTSADPYRLKPDVRVLEAAGDLQRLVTGGPPEDARAEFDGGSWRIVHRGVTVGMLPEYPEFSDLERLLTRWAATLGLGDSLAAARRRFSARAHGGEDAAIGARLARLEATAAADLADRSWSGGRRDAALLRLAAHALTLLSVQTVDEVGGSDRVAARALALVAACEALEPGARPLARTAGGWREGQITRGASAARGARRAAPAGADSVAADAALLADLMGYATAARARVQSLAADDPVRRFVLREDEALERLAGRKGSTDEARFLALLRIARRHDPEHWQRFKDRYFPGDDALALTCTSLEIGRFDAHLPAAIQVLAGVLKDLRVMGDLEDEEDLPDGMGSLEEMIQEFERLMGAMRPKADGVFLDADVLRAHYRTCFYSALTILGEHLRQALSSLPDTRAFASDLGEGDEGPAGEFQRWYTHLANAKAGKPELPALNNDLQAMPHFGAPLLLRTYQAIEEHTPYGDPGLRTAARRIAKNLDTRPQDLLAFAAIVHQEVLDLDRAELLYARGLAARGAVEGRLTAWWARYRQDADSLERMLVAPGLSAGGQADILENLAAIPGADSNAVETGWERCLRSNRTSWEVLDGYTRFARARGRYGKARDALERWLGHAAGRSGPFEEIYARTRLAESYADLGDCARGIEVVEPMVESQQLEAMDCMVSLLEKTGAVARAETLAVLAWGRYPDSPAAQARVAELCWRLRKYDLAARMLATAPVPLAPSDWRAELAPRFHACFGAKPADGLRAVDAILATGRAEARSLSFLAAGLDRAGDHGLAFEIQSRLAGEGVEAVTQLGVAYHFLRRWKGARAALDWLEPRAAKLTPPERAVLTYVGYELKDDELAWVVEVASGDRADIDFQWLLRAAASARMGAARDPHRAALERHFARRSDGRYAMLGRFLLGLEDESAALATISGAKSRCETYYYLGLRAQSEGAIGEAARRYAQCIETGQFSNGEYRWAFDQLSEWVSSNTSLARLEAEAKRKSRRPLTAAD